MEVQQIDLASAEYCRDPASTFAKLRAMGPLVRVKLPVVGATWLATTYESANALLHDQRNFVLQADHAGRKRTAGLQWWMPRSFKILAKNMLTTDEPDHRRLRSLVEQAFLRQSVEGMRERIGVLADQFLDDLEQQAGPAGKNVDLLKHFARPFPLAVICELLGLPAQDRPKFSLWAERLTAGTTLFALLRALPGIWRLLAYLRAEFQARRTQPREGLITALVQAEQDGKGLSENELLSMGFLLLLAGHETTVHLINGAVLTLLQHEDQKTKLLNDWSLAGSAVDESLRYMSPVQMTKPRYAARDCEFFGQSLKRGEFVLALLASANRDPDKFDQPDEFDITRQPNQHLTFGSGIHVCLGLKLARAEASIALEKLFTRFPQLHIAVPPEQLRWVPRLGFRALKEFPVNLQS